MVVVFLLRGLHNEAGNTKFRNVRQYIAHMGHVGERGCIAVGYECLNYQKRREGNVRVRLTVRTFCFVIIILNPVPLLVLILLIFTGFPQGKSPALSRKERPCF